MPSWLAIDLSKEIDILIYAHTIEPGSSIQLPFQPLPDCDSQVLRSWNLLLELRNLVVQMTVIKDIDHLTVHNFLQLLQVHDEPGALVHRTFDRHLEHVVMPMAIGIIAFAECP